MASRGEESVAVLSDGGAEGCRVMEAPKVAAVVWVENPICNESLQSSNIRFNHFFLINNDNNNKLMSILLLDV